MRRDIDPVRVLLVDDEPLARRSLRHLLASDPEVTVVGESGDGGAAIAAIDELAPDLVFLDIQMPEVDGFEVLERLPPHLQPVVVFVTAHDEHAVRAFEVHALDYLLKPVGRERFADALRRAKGELRTRSARPRETARWRALVEGSPTTEAETHLSRIAVRLNGRIRFVPAEEIDWIEAADYCSRLHVGERSYLIRKSMQAFERALDPECFIRIHRSSIVRIDRVVELRRLEHGAYAVILRDGTELRLTRSRRRALADLIHGSSAS